MQEWNPGKLLEVSGSYWQTCTLHAAVKLEIFTKIGEEILTAEAVADKLGGEVKGVSRLLNALVAMNLLERSEEAYTNTAVAKTFLSKNSEQYLGHMMMHHHHLVPAWAQLDQAVLSGKPIRERPAQIDESFLEGFLMGMFTLAMAIAPSVVELIDLSNKKNFLDMGGGPGTYAIHFCLKNPGLKGTVFDLPTSQPYAEKTIRKFGLKDRIDFLAGNYLEDHLSGSYDVAWLSQVLHGEGPESCQAMIDKAVSVLEPGGLIIIHEFYLNDTMDGPLFPAIFSLNMLLGTPNGQSYSEKQIRQMLEKSGVKKIQRLPFKGPTDSGLLMGEV